jgi:hypothetical protein
VSKSAHQFLHHAGYLPPRRTTVPKGYNKEIWDAEFKKARKYFLAKIKEE